MRRLVAAIATLGALLFMTPADAHHNTASISRPWVLDPFNPPPGDSHEVCVIWPKMNLGPCVYIPIP